MEIECNTDGFEGRDKSKSKFPFKALKYENMNKECKAPRLVCRGIDTEMRIETMVYCPSMYERGGRSVNDCIMVVASSADKVFGRKVYDGNGILFEDVDVNFGSDADEPFPMEDMIQKFEEKPLESNLKQTSFDLMFARDDVKSGGAPMDYVSRVEVPEGYRIDARRMYSELEKLIVEAEESKTSNDSPFAKIETEAVLRSLSLVSSMFKDFGMYEETKAVYNNNNVKVVTFEDWHEQHRVTTVPVVMARAADGMLYEAVDPSVKIGDVFKRNVADSVDIEKYASMKQCEDDTDIEEIRKTVKRISEAYDAKEFRDEYFSKSGNTVDKNLALIVKNSELSSSTDCEEALKKFIAIKDAPSTLYTHDYTYGDYSSLSTMDASCVEAGYKAYPYIKVEITNIFFIGIVYGTVDVLGAKFAVKWNTHGNICECKDKDGNNWKLNKIITEPLCVKMKDVQQPSAADGSSSDAETQSRQHTSDSDMPKPYASNPLDTEINESSFTKDVYIDSIFKNCDISSTAECEEALKKLIKCKPKSVEADDELYKYKPLYGIVGKKPREVSVGYQKYPNISATVEEISAADVIYGVIEIYDARFAVSWDVAGKIMKCKDKEGTNWLIDNFIHDRLLLRTERRSDSDRDEPSQF